MIGLIQWWRNRKTRAIRAEQEAKAAQHDAEFRLEETKQIASAMEPDLKKAREAKERNHIYDAVLNTLRTAGQ
jgi:hypothetical protein